MKKKYYLQLTIPFDCLNEIVQFMSSLKDIFSLIINSKQYFEQFIQNQWILKNYVYNIIEFDKSLFKQSTSFSKMIFNVKINSLKSWCNINCKDKNKIINYDELINFFNKNVIIEFKCEFCVSKWKNNCFYNWSNISRGLEKYIICNQHFNELLLIEQCYKD